MARAGQPISQPLTQALSAALWDDAVLGVVSTYVPQAVTFEGDTYIKRSSALSGVAATRYGSVSFWIDMTSLDGVVQTILGSSGGVTITRDTSNRISLRLAQGQNFTFRTTSSIVAADGWAHFCASWDTGLAVGAKVCQLLKNGVSDVEITSDLGASFSIDYPGNTSWSVGGTIAGANPTYDSIKDFLFWPGVQIDWNPANLAKVYKSGSPVDPGSDGSRVTGSAPAVCLSVKANGVAADFLTNAGSGGNFTLTAGALVLEKRPIIWLGDSLPAGTGASVFANCFASKTSRGLSPPWRQINNGHGGEGIGTIVSRFLSESPALLAAYPNALWVVEGGINSVPATPGTIEGGLATITNALASAGARYIVVGLATRNNSNYYIGGAYRAGFDTVVSNLITQYGSKYVNPDTLLKANSTHTGQDAIDDANGVVPTSKLAAGDDTHWNDAGHLIIANACISTIQSLGYG